MLTIKKHKTVHRKTNLKSTYSELEVKRQVKANPKSFLLVAGFIKGIISNQTSKSSPKTAFT